MATFDEEYTIKAKQEFLKTFSIVVNNYLESKPERSARLVARDTGISRNVIGAYASEKFLDSPETMPTLDTLIKHSEKLKNLKYRESENTLNDVKQIWETCSKNALRYIATGKLQKYLSDPIGSTIINWVSAYGANPTRADILRVIGAKADAVLTELINEELIFENKKGFLEAKFPYFCHIDTRTILQQIQYRVFDFNHENARTDASVISHFSGAVSSDGLKKIRKTLLTALNDVSETIKNDRGHHPVYLATLMNIFCNEKFKDEEK